MKNKITILRKELGVLVSAMAMSWACGSAIDAEPESEDAAVTGSLGAAIRMGGAPGDVKSVHYKVVAGNKSCRSRKIAEKTVSLEEEGFPGRLGPDGIGDGHRFADALFTLPPDDYRVCLTPLNRHGDPSKSCEAASGRASVNAEMTTEILLVSQCDGDPNGGLDVITVLNEPPHIEELVIGPSKFIETCQEATLTVTATDSGGDELSYEWEIVDGGSASLTSSDEVATFSSTRATDFTVKVSVTDALGASASLSFPIHVSESDKYCPVDCQVSDWSEWSECSAECGGGTQTRSRTIDVDAQNGGASCPDLEEAQECNVEDCPPVCPNDCSGNGTCQVGDICECEAGFTLDDCSRPLIEHVMVLDGSGSVGDTAFEEMKAAISTVSSQPEVLPLDGSVSIGVVLFAARPEVVFPLQPMDEGALDDLVEALSNMTLPNGPTGTRAAIEMATDLLRDGNPDAEKIIDLITDGNPTGPLSDPCPTRAELDSLGIHAHVIGVGRIWQPRAVECLVSDPDNLIGVDAYPTLGETLEFHLPGDFQTDNP